MSHVTFWVSGVPISKGSKTGFAIKTKAGKYRAVLVEDRKASLGPWMRAIKRAAEHSLIGMDWKLDGPMHVGLRFFMARPARHFGKRAGSPYLRDDAPKYHETKPDADKLARACLDALSGVAFMDDMQVYSLTATKDYGEPGCTVSIERTAS